MNIDFPYSSLSKSVLSVMANAVVASARHLDIAHQSRSMLDIQVKSDKSMVLNLDVESQGIILEKLGKTYPVIAEEDPQSHGLLTTACTYFTVDPLDGTTSCKRFLGHYGGQVGFGPLVGFVSDHRLTAVVFYSMPHRQLFVAVRGEGSYVACFDSDFNLAEAPRKLSVVPCPDLSKAGMLFFVSKHGEPRIVEYLKRMSAIENFYRFGSFASDSARVAQSFEQIQLQLYAKAWDFPAVLIAAEAGCDVYCDPLGRRIPLEKWRMEPNNPIVILPAGTGSDFFAMIDRI